MASPPTPTCSGDEASAVHSPRAPPQKAPAAHAGATVASAADKCGSVAAPIMTAQAERPAASATMKGESGSIARLAARSWRTIARRRPSIAPQAAGDPAIGASCQKTATAPQQPTTAAQRRTDAPSGRITKRSARALPAAASGSEPAAPPATPPMAKEAAARSNRRGSSNRTSRTSQARHRRADASEEVLLDLLPAGVAPPLVPGAADLVP